MFNVEIAFVPKKAMSVGGAAIDRKTPVLEGQDWLF
jgi:hypothetical protein